MRVFESLFKKTKEILTIGPGRPTGPLCPR